MSSDASSTGTKLCSKNSREFFITNSWEGCCVPYVIQYLHDNDTIRGNFSKNMAPPHWSNVQREGKGNNFTSPKNKEGSFHVVSERHPFKSVSLACPFQALVEEENEMNLNTEELYLCTMASHCPRCQMRYTVDSERQLSDTLHYSQMYRSCSMGSSQYLRYIP